jgi:hypothetical protein
MGEQMNRKFISRAGDRRNRTSELLLKGAIYICIHQLNNATSFCVWMCALDFAMLVFFT